MHNEAGTVWFGDIYRNKKVFITGHTGFKGSWLALWLNNLGAQVYGYALPPHTDPSLFEILNLSEAVHHEVADISDLKRLKTSIKRANPDIIFHLAAQSLVGVGYDSPYETIVVNTLGTANVIEAVRQLGISTAIVCVTSDKCYENREWLQGYRESDPMGGYDPYSASKGAAEILIGSWRSSFFNPADIKKHGVRLASVRAGNVVGGGDWSKDRIFPDCVRALENHAPISVRNPYHTRPWQHVLQPLSGYLQLGARLLDPKLENTSGYCEAFNFGPPVSCNQTVKALVEKVIEYWGSGSWECPTPQSERHESSLLNLSADKAFHKLQWLPNWSFDETVARTVEWYKMALREPSFVGEFTNRQIKQYESERGISSEATFLREVATPIR